MIWLFAARINPVVCLVTPNVPAGAAVTRLEEVSKLRFA